VVHRDVEGWARAENVLYRGDHRTPEEIRAAGGFGPPRPDQPADLLQHVDAKTNAFVSTTPDQRVGIERAGPGRLYVIHAPGGILTDPTLDAVGHDRRYGESEVLFPGGVDWRYVAGWHTVRYDPGEGRLVPGPFEPNPDYIGGPAAGDRTRPSALHETGQVPTARHPESPPDQTTRQALAGGPPPYQGNATAQAGPPVGLPPTADQARQTAGLPHPSHPATPGQPHLGHAPHQRANQALETNRTADGAPQQAHPAALGRSHDAPAGDYSFGPSGSDYADSSTDSRPEPARAEPDRAPERTREEPKPQRHEQPKRLREIADERLAGIAKNVAHTDAGMSLFDRAEKNESFTARQVKPIPGTFVIDMHGSPDQARVGRSNLSARDVAEILRANPGWDGKTPITLIGCDTGKLPNGFAAQLAKEAGVPVTAPNTDAWVDYEGNVFASQSHKTIDGHRPGWPPNGEWHTYGPDGTHQYDARPYPPGHTPTWGDGTPADAPKSAYRRGEPDSPYRSADTDPTRDGPLPTRQDTDRYLADPRLQDAIERANAISERDPDSRIKIDGTPVHIGEAIRQLLPRHPEMARMLRDVPYLEDSLIARPQTLANLLREPEAIQVLEHCVREVRDHPDGPAALAERYKSDPKPTPAILDQIEAQISASAKTAANRTYITNQPQFDGVSSDDPADRVRYLERLYDNWTTKQETLHRFATDIAEATGGEAHSRKTEKSRIRALDKIGPTRDASELADIVGSKIQYSTVTDAYKGLAAVVQATEKPDSKISIVDFDDRFLDPEKSGYRDLQMKVRMDLEDGDYHIAELRIHIHSIDEVARYEHPLYEVRRDFDAHANDHGRKQNTYEDALSKSILNEERVRFEKAFKTGRGRTEHPQ